MIDKISALPIGDDTTFLCCNSIHNDISTKAKLRERALLLERLDKKICELQKSRTDGLIPTAWVICAIQELYKEDT